jgi:hypothetical protein
MDNSQSLDRLLRREEEKLKISPEPLPTELKQAIEETRKKMRAAFAAGAKVRAKLKDGGSVSHAG